MEAVPRLFMISCELKVSPSNTDFGSTLKKYIKDHYHEDPDLYTKEIKELETLRQSAIKAPMDFTGCSVLKRYYSQLHMLQSRFPMTDDGAACVPFMWTDIYSGVAYNITDIEYEEACILYNIGALHSKLGTMDSRINAEGMKIGCTHFQCAAWAFQHLRDTFPQPKGSDMSHDLLSFFVNVMLAQAQECILEKSMLDSRKSSITAKVAAQVVDYYKCALTKMVKGSPNSGGFYYIVGSKMFTGWKKSIEFKVSYYMSISHLFMGNQSEEHEKWGERVAWFQSAYDHLMEAMKIAKNIGRDDLDEPLNFMMDVIGGKHSSSKKENEFVYHEKVPQTDSLQELKGASLVKGIPFSPTDTDVSGPDIFARLVPMEAHETSSLYSEEKAKILRSVATKIEEKNEELMAYLSSLQLESSTTFQEEEKIPQELLEKCAAMSVQPTATSDLTELMSALLGVSREVDAALKLSSAILKDEEQKEQKYQENFGKRVPSMIIVELTKECSKYEEAHKKAVESNNTLQAAVNIHLDNLCKLSSPLEDLVKILPSITSIKTPENVKVMQEFSMLLDKVDEMRNQRQYLVQQLRDSLLDDDITKRLVTLDKKEDIQKTFAEELKKHEKLLTYLDQNLVAQDNILCALTQANARNADTRKAIIEIKQHRENMVKSLVGSYEAYEDLIAKAKNGLEFYEKLHTNSSRLLSRVRSVTKVQDEERVQITEAELRKGQHFQPPTGDMPDKHTPKLKDYLPYLSKRDTYEAPVSTTFNNNTFSPIQHYPTLPQQQVLPSRPLLHHKPIEFDRNLKPMSGDISRSYEESMDATSMGVRPAPLGSEHNSLPAICRSSLLPNGLPDLKQMLQNAMTQQWTSSPQASNVPTSPGHAYYPNQASQGYVSLPHSDPSLTSHHTQANMQQGIGYNASNTNPQHYLTSSGPAVASHAQPTILQQGIDYGTPGRKEPYQLPHTSSMGQPPHQLSTSSGMGGPHQFQQHNHLDSTMAVDPNKTYLPQSNNLGHTNQQFTKPIQGPFVPKPALELASGNTPYNSYSQPYSSTGYPSQASPGNVTSQMDTRTNTFNSLNPNSNAGAQSAGYVSAPSSSVNAPGNIAYTSDYSGFVSPTNQQSSGAYTPSSSYFNSTPSVQTQTLYLNSNMPLSNTSTETSQTNASIAYAYQISANVYSTADANTARTDALGYFNSNGVPCGAANAVSVQQKVPNQPTVQQYSNQSGVQQYSNPAAIHSSQAVAQQYSNMATNYSQNVLSSQQNAAISLPQQNSVNSSFQQNATISAAHAALPGQQYSNVAYAQPNQNAGYSQQNQKAGYFQQNQNAGYIQQNNQNAGYIQQNNQNAAFPQVNQSPTFMRQDNNAPSIQHSTTASSNINQSSMPQPPPVGGHVAQYNLHATGSTVNQNNLHSQQLNQHMQFQALSSNLPLQPQQQPPSLSLPSSLPLQPHTAPIGQPLQLHTAPIGQPLQPHTAPIGQPLQPSSSDPGATVVVSKAYVADRRPSSTPLDSNPKLSIARDFITPPPESLSSRLDSGNSKLDSTSQSSFQILQPKVLDLKNIALVKDKEQGHLAKDPLDDPLVRARFVTEVEKYEKLVEGLLRKSLNGTTPLDQKWKELTDAQDKESRKLSISVARCYPLKNRFPDVMPYDSNRVSLTSAKDDYINASYLKDICSSSPIFILTQSPLPSTFNDFWMMVWEQQVETLLCVLPDNELKSHLYFPKEKGSILTFGSYEISLHSYKEKVGFTERMINITLVKNRMSRVVVHLQFTLWPASGIPSTPAPVLQFITDVLNYQKQQRNLLRPVVVHCSSGIGRSGCLCLITALVTDMNCGHGPKDVAQVAMTLSQQRKFLIQDKDQLKFCYDTVLYYAQDLLMRRGILTSRASFDDKLPGCGNSSTHVRHPSEDFILGGGGLAKLQSDMVKMGLSDASATESTAAKPETEIKKTEQVPEGGDSVANNREPTEDKTPKATDNDTEKPVTLPPPDKPLNSITSLLDPLNFTLDGASPAKRKITKEAFASSKGNLSASSTDSADPLSQLDPLWSMKKN